MVICSPGDGRQTNLNTPLAVDITHQVLKAANKRNVRRLEARRPIDCVVTDAVIAEDDGDHRLRPCARPRWGKE